LPLSTCRLKTIRLNSTGNILYAGDYDGCMYKLSSHTQPRNLKTIHGSTPEKSPAEKPIGSSIAGIEFLADGNLAVATRWKQLFILSESLAVIDIINTPDCISSMTMYKPNKLLLGTRSGVIYSYDLNKSFGTFEIVIQEPPIKQKENTVTSLTKNNNAILATFADGITYSLDFRCSQL
jgi:hypothetical protein